MRIRRFLLGKARGKVLTIPTTYSITYNGSNQTLITAGQGTGTMLYKLNNGSWSYNLPQAINAGTYTVYYKTEENRKYKESESGSITVIINKVTPTVTAPTAKSLIYNASALNLVNAGSTNWGTIKYSLDNINFGENISTATNVGSYRVYYRVDGDSNINSVASKYIDNINILPKTVTNPTITLETDTYTYNGQEKKPTVSSVKDGNITISSTEYTVSYTNNINAGTATCIITDKAGGNYIVSGTKTYTINKADPSYTAPTAKSLTYSGSALSLLNSGSTNDGTIQYSSDGSTWSTTIPTATNAGSHNTYWRLVGDAQHKDIASTKIVVTIGKKSISPSVSMSGWTYGGTASSPSVSGNDGSGTVTYKYKVNGAADSTYTTTKPSNAGTYVVWASIAETSNYQSGSATNTFTISKANISPSVSMSGWTYGGTASSPSVSGNTGNGGVTYAYKTSGAADSTYSSTKPSSAGTYTVRASIDSTTNYNSATCTTNFTISKANPTYSAPTAKTGLTYSGSSQTLYNDGSNTTSGSFSYTNGTRTDAGSQTVSWSFTPTDTTNYNSKSGSFDVTIAKASRGGSISLGSNNIIVGSSTTVQISSYSGVGDGTISYSTNNNNITISGTTVNGVSAGTSIITGFITEGTNYTSASYTITITIYSPYGTHNGHDYVEIGGIKWATTTIGASSVTDEGMYFLWGETTGYYASQLTQTTHFSKSNYIYFDADNNPTKYTLSDNKKILDASDDAATVNWGGNWRMPTYDEALAFINAVTVLYTTNYNNTGVSGFICTDKNNSAIKIFFPCNAYIRYDGDSAYDQIMNRNEGSYYPTFDAWTSYVGSSKYEVEYRYAYLYGYLLYPSTNKISIVQSSTHRNWGHMIRPVTT